MAVPRPALLLLPLLLIAVPPFGAHAQSAPPVPPDLAHPSPAHHATAPAHPASSTHHETAHPPVVHGQAHPPRQKPPHAHAAAPSAVVPPPPSGTPGPAAPAQEQPATPGKGSVTGLPLPRFASLRSDDVNLRAGPGTQYPIDWVYKRRDLPVQIEREFDVWRLVSDQDGIRGWVNQATLMARRGFVVAGAERVLRNRADDQASPVARLQLGVIGRLRACTAGSDWCEVQVGEYRGWLKRDEIWGVLPGEMVQP